MKQPQQDIKPNTLDSEAQPKEAYETPKLYALGKLTNVVKGSTGIHAESIMTVHPGSG